MPKRAKASRRLGGHIGWETRYRRWFQDVKEQCLKQQALMRKVAKQLESASHLRFPRLPQR